MILRQNTLFKILGSAFLIIIQFLVSTKTMISEGDLLLNKDNNLQDLLSEISVSDTRSILFGTLGIYLL